jgi:hypothetical protein
MGSAGTNTAALAFGGLSATRNMLQIQNLGMELLGLN